MKQYNINHTFDLRESLRANDLELISYTHSGKQLKSMQAWCLTGEVEDQTTGEVIKIDILQSYNTLVAYRINGQTVRVGHYSPTTSKQTTIWERSFR